MQQLQERLRRSDDDAGRLGTFFESVGDRPLKLHERRDGGVEVEAFGILADAPDRAMLEARQGRLGATGSTDRSGSDLVDPRTQIVDSIQEPERPGYAVLGPLRLFFGRP